MKKILLMAALAAAVTFDAAAQEWKIITVVESIIPAGTGRSRIIEAQQTADSETATTARVDGKKSKQGDVKRGDLKIENFSETKLLNFFSAAGINMQNIASNDAMVTDRINRMMADGWSLEHIVAGVESDSGKDDGKGIYVTRLYFKK
jgi:hypothetical protein